VLRRLHRLVRLDHLAVRPDEVRDTARARPVVLGRAIRLGERTVRIAEEKEREVELLGEGAVLLDGVEAGAPDDGLLVLELADSITESFSLERSTRGVGLGIEPEQDVTSALVAELHRPAVVGRELEVGSVVARFQHRHAASTARQSAVVSRLQAVPGKAA
jgi:hypothetical protein